MVAAVSSVEAPSRVATLPCARKWPSSLDGRSMRPIRGTWHPRLVRRTPESAPHLVPLVSCPRCATPIMLVLDADAARVLQEKAKPGAAVRAMHAVDADGNVSPEPRCGCGWYGAVRLEEWNRWQTLFCAMVLDGNDPLMRPVYTHAIDANEAAWSIAGVRPGRRLVSIAPVIRNDREGTVLL